MLAGNPIRFSSVPELDQYVLYDGFIKLRLGHSRRGTVIVPDLIFAKAGPWRFFQPSFFGPCSIAFNVEVGLHVAKFSLDVGSPRSTLPTRLLVSVRSDAQVLAYPDGSQLYACQFDGPRHLAPCGSGRCRRMPDGDFALKLFHHTNPAAYASIRASQQLWASAWNLQGTRRLVNVAYVYFTSLPKIRRPEDLNRIAMASNGVLRFQTTSRRLREEVLEIQVYREKTTGRTSTLEIEVPSAFLAPSHLNFHPLTDEPAYYEIVGPEIFRVGLQPGSVFPIPRSFANPLSDELKRFHYIVLGDTSEIDGLGAPYDEEETDQVMHHEQLDRGLNLFEFWLANANTDQVSGRVPEPIMLEPNS